MGTFYFDLVNGEKEHYAGLKAVVDELSEEWHLMAGTQTGGWANSGIEQRAFHYVDALNQEVMSLRYNNLSGRYKGTLKASLDFEKLQELNKRAGLFLSALGCLEGRTT